MSKLNKSAESMFASDLEKERYLDRETQRYFDRLEREGLIVRTEEVLYPDGSARVGYLKTPLWQEAERRVRWNRRK